MPTGVSCTELKTLESASLAAGGGVLAVRFSEQEVRKMHARMEVVAMDVFMGWSSDWFSFLG